MMITKNQATVHTSKYAIRNQRISTLSSKARRQSGFNMQEIVFVTAITALLTVTVISSLQIITQGVEHRKVQEGAKLLLTLAAQQIRTNCRAIMGDPSVTPVIPAHHRFAPDSGPLEGSIFLANSPANPFAPLTLAEIEGLSIIPFADQLNLFGVDITENTAVDAYPDQFSVTHGPWLAGIGGSGRIGPYHLHVNMSNIAAGNFTMRNANVFVQLFIANPDLAVSDAISEAYEGLYNDEEELARLLGADSVRPVFQYDDFSAVSPVVSVSSVELGKVVNWFQRLGNLSQNAASLAGRASFIQANNGTARACLF